MKMKLTSFGDILRRCAFLACSRAWVKDAQLFARASFLVLILLSFAFCVLHWFRFYVKVCDYLPSRSITSQEVCVLNALYCLILGVLGGFAFWGAFFLTKKIGFCVFRYVIFFCFFLANFATLWLLSLNGTVLYFVYWQFIGVLRLIGIATFYLGI